MSVSAFGNYIRELRKTNGLNQAEMAAELGISAATLSRIEAGERVPSFTEFQAIMQTLGQYSGDYLSVYLTEGQLEFNNEVSKLHSALNNGRKDDAEKYLRQVKDSRIKPDKHLLQYIVYAEVMLDGDMSNEKAIERLMAALRMTKENIELPNVDGSILRENEILILDEIAYRRSLQGETDFAIALLENVVDSIDHHYIDEREKARTYSILIFNLSQLLGRRGEHKRVLKLCSSAIEMAIQFNNMRVLPSLIYCVASARYFIKDVDGCKRALIESYYTARAMEQFEDSEKIKKNAKEAFGIEFTY